MKNRVFAAALWVFSAIVFFVFGYFMANNRGDSLLHHSAAAGDDIISPATRGGSGGKIEEWIKEVNGGSMVNVIFLNQKIYVIHFERYIDDDAIATVYHLAEGGRLVSLRQYVATSSSGGYVSYVSNIETGIGFDQKKFKIYFLKSNKHVDCDVDEISKGEYAKPVE